MINYLSTPKITSTVHTTCDVTLLTGLTHKKSSVNLHNDCETS